MYQCTNIEILFDFIAVFSDIYYEVLGTVLV